MICWINPFTGLAGDMLLAALIDAGSPLPAIRAAIDATGLTGWDLAAEPCNTHGLAATRVRVTVTDHQTSRSAAELLAMGGRATPEPVARLAVSALSAIARVEARLHGKSEAEVHLHELGGHDTIVDIVGVAAALHALGVDQIVCAPLPLGHGRIRGAHGLIPSPAPATLALLEGASTATTDLAGETVTPTAAALLKAGEATYGPLPAMSLRSTGYGAGTRVLPDRPNLAAVTIGERHPARDAADRPVEPVIVLETNLDDVTGEQLGHLLAKALAAGALDAWATPAIMKKGRPAHILHVLTHPAAAGLLEHLVLAETGSLGVRRTTATRTPLPRRIETVDVEGHAIRIKIGPHGAKPEFDDTAAVAEQLDLPLREVAARALELHTRQVRSTPRDVHDD